MKISVIGGGSTYTPELIQGFLDRYDHLPVTELWLMDIDSERLKIVGGFASQIVAAQGKPFKVILSQNQQEAVAGASYVITQFRVGMMAARRADEYLGLRHQLIGQETTGIGGMAKALRTVPVILSIAKDIRESAPDALLVNFTNPSGLITQALKIYAPDIESVGVCNAPFNTRMDLLHRLEALLHQSLDPDQAELDVLGLNHLTWYRGFRYAGEDVWQEVFSDLIEDLRRQDHPLFDTVTLENLGMLPNSYLSYYYYPDKKIEDQRHWPPSRAEAVMEIEQDLLRQYALPEQTQIPEGLMKRGGAYYSTVATQLINAHYNDLGETHVVNTANAEAVPGWPKEWVLELPCQVGRSGIRPLPTQALPPVCSGLLAQVKAYELLTAEAAHTGNRRLAYQALLAHPLGPTADQVQTVLDDLLNTHRAYLPAFWR